MKLKVQKSKFQRKPTRQAPIFAGGSLGSWLLKLFFSFELCALSFSSALRAEDSLSFQLLPAAQVDSSGIFLHQLIAPQFSARLPTRLAPAPAVGQTAALSRTQINELLQRVAPEFVTSNWSGAMQVRVTRRMRSLGEAELRELLTATLQNQFVKEKGELELRFRSPWSAINVPDEAFALKVVDFPATGVNSSFIVRFELLSAAEKVGEWQVVSQGKLMREVLVARAALKRGQLLSASDFTTERRDIVPLREPVAVSALQDEALLELSENMAEGQPLLARSVRQHPVVQRGKVVDAVIMDGAMNISMKVEALSDGVTGQTIRVRNPRTKREFFGRVQNEQRVEVRL